MQNFRALCAPPPDPRVYGGWELRPQTPIGYLPPNNPPLRISGYAPVIYYLYMLLLSLTRL